MGTGEQQHDGVIGVADAELAATDAPRVDAPPNTPQGVLPAIEPPEQVEVVTGHLVSQHGTQGATHAGAQGEAQETEIEPVAAVPPSPRLEEA